MDETSYFGVRKKKCCPLSSFFFSPPQRTENGSISMIYSWPILVNRASGLLSTRIIEIDVPRSIEIDVVGMERESRRKQSSSREVVLRQLSSTSHRGRKRRFKAFLQECKFDLVRKAFLDFGAVEVDYKRPWIVAWSDGVIPMEKFTRMKPYQKINHFPGMSEICKKDLLASNLKRMRRMFPKEYNFFPLTFCLPDEARSLSNYCQTRGRREVFIIKPDKNCQGSGIDIVRGIEDAKQYRNVVCQKYISTPLLMHGFKLDLRLYVLLTSVSPLRIYVYEDGLVRLATVPYKKPSTSNMNEKRMHLTNYAINRKPSEDLAGEWIIENCKKSFSDLEAFLDSLKIEHDNLWPTIDGMIVKTILSALPTVKHLYHTSFPMLPAMCPCFEILGFDVLLSNRIKPYLLEVNRSPSLGASTSMDRHLKRNLVSNVLDMVLPTSRQISLLNDEQHIKAVRRLTNCVNAKHPTARERIVAEYQEKREEKKMGNFRQIYPADDGRYDTILRAVFSDERGLETELPSTADGTDSNESDPPSSSGNCPLRVIRTGGHTNILKKT